MYAPIKLYKKTEKIVTKQESKKYYRFHPTGFYGGIATANTVGCNLRFYIIFEFQRFLVYH